MTGNDAAVATFMSAHCRSKCQHHMRLAAAVLKAPTEVGGAAARPYVGHVVA